MFGYNIENTEDSLLRLIKRYNQSNRAIQVDFRKLVTTPSNTDRATHLLHPYPAKLLTHIPFFFLANNVLSKTSDTILDPFSGSGTVVLESILSGRKAICADSNPFARLLSRVKTQSIPKAKLESASSRLKERIRKNSFKEDICLPDVVNLSHWFFPHVTRQLVSIREAIASTRQEDIRDFFWICFSNCARKVSLADPRLSVPVRLKEGQYPKGHFLRDKTDAKLRQLKRINVSKVFSDILDQNIKRLAILENIENYSYIDMYQDARELIQEGNKIEGQVQLIITSPPYPGAQKYVRSSSLSLGWLDLCKSSELMQLKRNCIGREEFRKSEVAQQVTTKNPSANRQLEKLRKINPIRATIAGTYLNEMELAIKEMYRCLRPGGFLVLVSANSTLAGMNFHTERYLRKIAEEVGLSTKLRLIDDIQSRGLMTKRNKTASMITREWVTLLEKN